MIHAAVCDVHGVDVFTGHRKVHITFHAGSSVVDADGYIDFSIETEDIPYIPKERIRVRYAGYKCSDKKRNKWCKYRHKEGLRYKEAARVIEVIDEEEV